MRGNSRARSSERHQRNAVSDCTRFCTLRCSALTRCAPIGAAPSSSFA